MAKDKKSFLLYTDIHHTLKHLTDVQCGKLFKHLLAYVNDENPELNDTLLKIAFEPIKQSLKRDLKLYNDIREKRSKAGKKSGKVRSTKAKRTKRTSVQFDEQKGTNPTVNVSDSVSVSVSTDVDGKKGAAVKDRSKEINDLCDKFLFEVKKGEHKQATELWKIQNNISGFDLKHLMEDFRTNLITQNKLHKNTLELRKHFYNFINRKQRS